MKLWADACVTPTLEEVAHARGYEATSNRRRGLLKALDAQLYPIVVGEDWVFITNNELDFRRLANAQELHPGLIVLPQGRADQQQAWLHTAIDFIEKHSAEDGEEAWAWMICRIVVYDDVSHSIGWEWIPEPL